MAQRVKNLPAVWETQVRFLGPGRSPKEGAAIAFFPKICSKTSGFKYYKLLFLEAPKLLLTLGLEG